MSADATVKFWFNLDGNKYGARFATVREQAACMVEMERMSNGKYSQWAVAEDEQSRSVAFLIQISVFLSKLIVSWPVGVPPVDFFETDDTLLLVNMWEAYSKAATTFRDARIAARSGEADAAGAPA